MTFIIAFDFDKTITKISIPVAILCVQWNWDPSKFEKTIDYIIDKIGIDGVISKPFLHPRFIEYLRMLKRKYNAKIIITSFGLNDAIRIIIRKLGISDIFDDVLTPSSLGLLDGHEYFDELDGKNKMMAKVQRRNNVPNYKVILIDDHVANVELAEKKGYKTSFVPERRGITKQNVVDIKRFSDSQIDNP